MNPFTPKARSWMVPLLTPLIVLGGMLGLHNTPFGRQVENLSEDWRFQFRASSDSAPDERILVAGIGDYSLNQIGKWEDWTRNVHGVICGKLALRPPRVIVYDFFFPEPSKDRSNDLAFADGLSLHPGAITGAVANPDSIGREPYDKPGIGKTEPIRKIAGSRDKLLKAKNGTLPIEDISVSAWTGFVNAPPSGIDGMRRTIPLIVDLNGAIYPSLVLQTIIQYEGLSPDDVEVIVGKHILLSRNGKAIWRIPIDRRGHMTINYRKTSVFAQWDYIKIGQLIEESENTGEWPESNPRLENQIMLIGQMAEGLYDFGPTPFKAIEPNVFVQANALNTILSNDYVRTVKWPYMAGFWLALAWSTMLLLHRSKTSRALLVPLTILILAVVAGFLLFRYQSIMVPLVLPVAGFFLIHATTITHKLINEARMRVHLKNVLATYISPELVRKIVDSGEPLRLGGEKSEITVFFSDVQNFSSFSEELTPEELVSLMITYLSEMTDVLMDHGGLLDKYIGDAIVGMFGALIPATNHAHQAVAASIAIQKCQNFLRERWREEARWPESVYHMQTRIGLNTGEAIIGNMGSNRRFNYTMMGDTVNLAARCESGAKLYGVNIMITGDTRKAAMASADDVVYRFLDRIVVKGRTEPVDMFEVIGFKTDVPQNVMECLSIYQKGIDAYLKTDWDAAIGHFSKSSLIESWQPGIHTGVSANPSNVMIQRSKELKASPPPREWDGIYQMTTK